ncbi:MAG: hypothetical protein JWP87_5288 [Labilithrix sp.]|nr:hypothetical protein [Labilithrix sp.]
MRRSLVTLAFLSCTTAGCIAEGPAPRTAARVTPATSGVPAPPRHDDAAYVAGSVLSVFGGSMTLMGVTTSSIAAATPNASAPANSEDRADRNAFMSLGLVTLGVGLATTAAGLLLLTIHRPEGQVHSLE